RRDDRADLTLEEPGAEHVPAFARTVERDHGILALAAHVETAVGRGLEEGTDRHAESGREFTQRWQRWREPPRLDLRDHWRRQPCFLGELPLLAAALASESLDPRPQRGHLTSTCLWAG